MGRREAACQSAAAALDTACTASRIQPCGGQRIRRPAQNGIRGHPGERRNTRPAKVADGLLTGNLDDHQAINLALLTAPGSWGGCIFDEQGTGKTVTLIATFDVLVERRLTDTLLVVAPKSMVAEWRQEFARFTGDLYRVVIAEGDRHDKADALFSGADVVVLNYETLAALDDEIVRLARRTRLALAVDESFNVKNPDACRTNAAIKVREWCTHAFVLCGTPAPNSAADIVSQFDLVDFGYTFAGLRLDKDKATAPRQVGERLADRGLFVRNLKSVVLPDLPTKSFTQIEVDLAPQQQAAYDAALNDLIVDLRRVDDEAYTRQIQSFLERRSALLRICADPAPIIAGYLETPAKIGALDDLLRHLVDELSEKVVIWSFYRASLDRIAARYAEMGLVRIDGSVTDAAERRSAVRQVPGRPCRLDILGQSRRRRRGSDVAQRPICNLRVAVQPGGALPPESGSDTPPRPGT